MFEHVNPMFTSEPFFGGEPPFRNAASRRGVVVRPRRRGRLRRQLLVSRDEGSVES